MRKALVLQHDNVQYAKEDNMLGNRSSSSSLLLSSVIQKSMSLKYEPSSEPLHITCF